MFLTHIFQLHFENDYIDAPYLAKFDFTIIMNEFDTYVYIPNSDLFENEKTTLGYHKKILNNEDKKYMYKCICKGDLREGAMGSLPIPYLSRTLHFFLFGSFCF